MTFNSFFSAQKEAGIREINNSLHFYLLFCMAVSFTLRFKLNKNDPNLMNSGLYYSLYERLIFITDGLQERFNTF